jgi:predicted outer membrane repeat protein
MSDSQVTDNGDGGVYDLSFDADVSITGSTFSGNHSGGPGGAILFDDAGADTNVSIANSVFTGNSADGDGGAIDMPVRENSTMTIANCTISHNTATGVGGALYLVSQQTTITNSTLSGNTATSGGAILTGDTDLTLDASTLHANTATGATDPDGFGAGEGGGLYVNGGTTITNSTLSGNKAADAGGGAYVIYNLLTVSSSTITGNTAPAGNGAGIAQDQSSQASVTNSIIDKNTGDDVDLTQGNNPPGFVSGGYNLIGTGNAVSVFNQPGDQTGVSQPKLGPLASNGGPTKTHALLPGSPAIGTGDNAGCPATDQRGLPRPQGSGCDIGSFQVQTG